MAAISAETPSPPAPLPKGEGSNSRTTAKDVFFFIPHTHWEGAVFKTREEYLDLGLPNILRALRLLKKHANYRFVLDQVCYVKPFLERYPEEEAAFRKFVAEGRLAIVGGTDVMPDVNMPSGESFVRQMLYGKGYYREKLGVDVTVGWQLDTFGHHAQMPQLMKLGGYKSFWTQRGVPNADTPSEFLWEGLDGTQIPAFWTPLSYAWTYGSPKDLPGFVNFFTDRFNKLGPYSRGRGRVGLAGADVCEPEEHVPGLVEQFNRRPEAPFELRLALPADFESLAAQRPDRPVVRGDLNPIFQGVYSSRIELKQRTRELERLLTTDEKLAALLGRLGTPANEKNLWRAWEPMLFNQAHDLMSGVMTDRVYEDTIRGYDFSRRIAVEELDDRLQKISAAIDTRGEGVAVAVWNMLSWPRTDIALAEVGFSDGGVVDVSLVAPDGQATPVQLLNSVRAANGDLLRAEVAFVARDVPPLGYAVYRLLPLRKPADTAAKPVNEPILENDDYRLEFDPAGGAITRLLVKSRQWNALSGPGNVVAREEDRGDLWELYHNLQMGFVASKTPHSAPAPGKAVFSNQQAAKRGTTSRGPVVSEFKVDHPFGQKGGFATTVRLYPGVRRIDIRTSIVNEEKNVRYRALFPTSIGDGKIVHEIPFGAIQRPAGIECPAQNWVDYGNGKEGLAVLNRGLPGNNAADGTLMLSLLRSTRIQAYGYGGGYEPGMSSDSGFELGKQHTFDYALVPHAGDWREAGIWREGLEFNNPLLARTAASHPGSLPKRWGFVEITPANVVVSTLKPGADGSSVLRLYEAAGQPTKATIRLSVPVAAAEEVNLMEDPGFKLAVADNTLKLNLRPFEIKTIKLQLQSAKPRAGDGPDPVFEKPAPVSMAELAKQTTPGVSALEVNDYTPGRYTGALTPSPPHADMNPRKAVVVFWKDQPQRFIFSHEASYCPIMELPNGAAMCNQFFEGNLANAELLNNMGRRERNSFVDIIQSGPERVWVRWNYFANTRYDDLQPRLRGTEDYFAYPNGLVLRRMTYESLMPDHIFGYSTCPVELFGVAPVGSAIKDLFPRDAEHGDYHTLAVLDLYGDQRYDIYWGEKGKARRRGDDAALASITRSPGYALVMPFRDRLLFAVLGSASGFPPEKNQIVDHCTLGAEGGAEYDGLGLWDHWPIGWLNSQTNVWKPGSPYPYSFGSVGQLFVPEGKRIRSFWKDYSEYCKDMQFNRWTARRVFYVLLGTAHDWDDVRRIGRGWLDKGKQCARPESIADLK